jgi:hypothetical protein
MSALTQPEPVRVGKVVKADLQALDALEAEAVGVFCFSDTRPLQGAAGYLDWRLCGALSQAMLARHFEGEVGEALLVPAFGRLKLKRVFVFGLGEQGRADLAGMKQAARRAVEVMHGAGVRRFVLLAPGHKRRPDTERLFVKAVSEELPGRVETMLVEHG